MKTEIFKTKQGRLEWVVQGLKLQIKKIDEEMAIQEQIVIKEQIAILEWVVQGLERQIKKRYEDMAFHEEVLIRQSVKRPQNPK